MATTYNFTDASVVGTVKPHDTTPRAFKPYILRNIVDTSLQNVANDTSIVQALNVPADTLVLGAWIRIITVDAGGGLFQLGYAAGAEWGDALSLATAGYVESTLTFDAPHLFTSADTIDLTEDGAASITTAVIEVSALCVDAQSDTFDGGDVSYTAQS